MKRLLASIISICLALSGWAATVNMSVNVRSGKGTAYITYNGTTASTTSSTNATINVGSNINQFTIKAVPAAGYKFVSWSDYGTAVFLQAEVTLAKSPKYISCYMANFEEVAQNVTISVAVANGCSGMGGVSGGGTVQSGQSVIITATPSGDAFFKGWSTTIDGTNIVSGSSTATVTAASNMTYYAVFGQADMVSISEDHSANGLSKSFVPAPSGGGVDLGLPSGTLWAEKNVGASSEYGYGPYFAWGSTTALTAAPVKAEYPFAASQYDSYYTLPLAYDAAYVNMGEGWRMPTREEMEELVKYAKWDYGVQVWKVSGNGNTITLNLAGHWVTRSSQSGFGRYWTSTKAVGSGLWKRPYYLELTTSTYKVVYDKSTSETNCYYGYTVRAVRDGAPAYMLKVNAKAAGEISTNTYRCNIGQPIQIKPIEVNKNSFLYWLDSDGNKVTTGVDPTTHILTVTMTENKTYTAVFSDTYTDSDTICESDLSTYTWEGEHFTKDNLVKTKTLTSSEGRDSIVTFTLVLKPVYTGITDGDTICESGLSGYEWEGEHFTKESLVKTKTLTSVQGCDSTVTFTLTVHPQYTGITDGDTICESGLSEYVWEGEHFTKENLTKTKTLATKVAGCDSTVTFTLVLKPVYTGITDGDTICESELSKYEWEGEHFTKDELTKTKTLTSSVGCDSVVTFTLTVNPSYNIAAGDTICESMVEEYEWEGESFMVDDLVRKKRLTSVTGCDSVVTFTLVLKDEYWVWDRDTICESELSSYVWEGEHFTKDQLTKTKTLTSSVGCDSVVTFKLTVLPSYVDITDGDTICESELSSYEWEGEHFTKDELTKTKTLTTTAGCDSVVTFTLVVNKEYKDIQTGATICESALPGFTWEGEHFTKDELVKTKTLTTKAGCDSVVTFTLVLNDAYVVTDGDAVCESELATYTWEGEHFTRDELTKTKTLTSIQGCDSIVTFTLTLKPEYLGVTDGDTICESGLSSYEWEGEHFTKDELTKVKTLTTVTGCDSVVTFTLTVNPEYTGVMDGDTICESGLGSYEWEGEHFTKDNLVKSKTLTTAAGCDSVVTFTLTVNKEYTDVLDGDTICESGLSSYEWESEHFTKDELVKTKTLTTVAGCDSVVTFTLTVLPIYKDIQDGDTICESGLGSYEWEGEHFTKDELVKTKTLTTKAGCDSVVTFTLVVNHEYTGVMDGDTICESGLSSYEWEGEHFTKDELVKTKTLTTIQGCDSTVTFTLTVNPEYTGITDGDTICESGLSSYEWEGEHFTKDELTKTKTLTSSVGCDSTVTFTLTVLPIYKDIQDGDTICESGLSSYEWEGEHFTKDELVKTKTLTTIAGCDSVVTFTLMVLPEYKDMQDGDTICESGLSSYEWEGEQFAKDDLVKIKNIGTKAGCDSIVTFTLVLLPEYTDVEDGDTICESGLSDYIWEGEHFAKDERVKIKNLGTKAGCDSIVTFTLTVLPEYTDVQDGAIICETALNDFTWEGEHFTKDDLVKTKTLTTKAGCDSTVTFTLVLNDAYIVTDGDVICESELATYTWEGEHFTKDDLVKTKTLASKAGCDSVVTFTLTVLPIYKDIQDGDIICESELAAYTWEGEHFTKEGLVKTKTLTTAAGCDSVVTFTLTVLPIYKDIQDGDTICESELADYEWEGEHFTKDNLVKTKTLTTAAGCDSVVTFTLTVMPIYQDIQDGDVICESELAAYAWEGERFTKGNLVKTKTLTTMAGCDSVVTFTLTVLPIYKDIQDGDVICESELAAYTWEGEHFTKGNLVKTKTLTTVAGCDSVVTFTLTVNEDKATTDKVVKHQYELPFVWNGIQISNAAQTGTQVTLSTYKGCDSVVTLNLVIWKTVYTTDTQTKCAKELPFMWNGIEIRSAGQTGVQVMLTGVDCDSIVTLDLMVIDAPLKGKAEIETNTCDPDKDHMLLSYVLNAGYPVSYSVRFSKAAHEQGFEDITSEDINAVGETSIRIPKPTQAGHPEFYPRPDDYSLSLVVKDLCHDSVTYSVPFTLLYPAWIIAQRWNDVLALYNSTYNGGYEFEYIQWYFRGETIADKGENSSYIQVLPNLAYGEAYYALLRRVGESKAFRTCDVYPVDKNPKNVESRIRIYAVRMDDLRQVGVESEEGGKYYVYDVTGKQLQSGRFGDDGSTTSVIRLSHNYLPGTYVLWLRTDSGEELVKKWVID